MTRQSGQSNGSANATARAALLTATLSALFVVVAGCTQSKAPLGTTGSTTPPKNVDLYVAGALAKDQGKREQAVERLLNAVTTNPNLIMAREMLGDLYREAGDYSKAEDEYEVLTKLDPYGSESWRKLGVAQQLREKLKVAADSYNRALKLNPKDWESAMNVGVVYFALGYRDHAVDASEAGEGRRLAESGGGPRRRRQIRRRGACLP